MKVGVIGANGQLGSDVVLAFLENGDNVIKLNHDKIELEQFESVEKVLSDAQPEVIVNTAAMHHLDQCEQDPVKSFKVNGIGLRNLALVSKKMNCILVQISTDYVFDGRKQKPYLESDPPAPLNVYGNTKLCGEYFIASIMKNYFILRTSGVYGSIPCRAKGQNFVELMLKLAKERNEIRVVDNEVLTPTYTISLAKQIVNLTMTKYFGLYHATSQGHCSWYEFAKKIFQITGTKIKLYKADSSEFSAKTPRPSYSVLDNHCLQSLNLDCMPHWEVSLKQYLDFRKDIH
jgi:dTDP-4-dehydrorhamnose reductase